MIPVDKNLNRKNYETRTAKKVAARRRKMMRAAKIMMTYLRKRYPWLFIILRIAAAVLGAPGFSFFRLLLEKLLF